MLSKRKYKNYASKQQQFHIVTVVAFYNVPVEAQHNLCISSQQVYLL